MIMVLQVGEQGRARSRRRRRRRRRPNAVVRLLFHAVSISSADAAARSCRLPTWGSEGEGAGPAGAESGRPESGWAGGRPEQPEPESAPSFNERDGCFPLSLPLSISLSLSLASRDGRTGIYRVGALAAQIAGRSVVRLSFSPLVLVFWSSDRECAANDFEAG